MYDNTVQNENKEEIVVNLFALVRGVAKDYLRNILKILLAAVLVGAVFFAGTRMNRKSVVYTASASFIANRASEVRYKTGYQQNWVNNRVSIVLPLILGSDALKSVVMDDLGYSSEDFDAEFLVSKDTGVNEMRLLVRSGDSELAYKALESALRNYQLVTEPTIGKVDLTLVGEIGKPSKSSAGSSGTKEAAEGMIIALVAAAILLAAKRVISRTIQTGEKAAGTLETELLGSLPGTGRLGRKSSCVINAADCPREMIEAVRMIRLNLEKIARERGAKTIMFTSALSAEGKTTAAANIALAFARRQKKVLLVDGNLRNPSVLPALGMPQAEKGLADLLAGQCGPESVMVPCNNEKNLILIPGGALNGLPAALWSGSEADRLFREWRDSFDYIFIDSSAAASASDSALIARLADGCVFVTQTDRVDKAAVRKGAGAVSDAGCEIIGCILNADH